MFPKKVVLAFVIIFLLAAGLTQTAKAGFGVTSPYLENDRLIPGAYYEKEMIIVRGDPIEDWKCEFSIDVPGADNWISINKGMSFILPKDEKQTPITIAVNVPKDAKFDHYKGAIRIRTLPVEPTSGVSIALGARINVDLDVVKDGVFDFLVENVKTFDMNQGWKIKLGIEIKNTGNIEASPTRIYLDIYDSANQVKIASLESGGLSDKVKPFQTKEVIAEFPNQLKAGLYYAHFKIFKRDQLAKEGDLNLSVLPPGTLPSPNQSPLAFVQSLTKGKWGLAILIIILLALSFTVFRIIKKKKN
jgi:hypothetical protein